MLFFFNDTATTEIYTLSLHDALPICEKMKSSAPAANTSSAKATAVQTRFTNFMPFCISMIFSPRWWDKLQSRGHKLSSRSEEHTSELQSPCNLVCRLLLEKNKHNTRH